MTVKQCPFGERLQRYWDRRYDYFSRFDEGIRIDDEGLHTVMPEKAALQQGILIPDAEVVLDGFCGVGGLAIAYARLGKKVIAVDNNVERLAMARNNSNVYGVTEQITFIHGDFFDVAPTVKADAVILDPPWGWPKERKMSLFHLYHFEPDGNKLLPFTLNYFDTLILRAPAIFDLSELDRFSDVNYVKHQDMLHDEVISLSILIREYPA